ncbi:19496_t:CDS:1, partial [Rhizophagus irregularis]
QFRNKGSQKECHSEMSIWGYRWCHFHKKNSFPNLTHSFVT